MILLMPSAEQPPIRIYAQLLLRHDIYRKNCGDMSSRALYYGADDPYGT
jgi:hypothetical protein